MPVDEKLLLEKIIRMFSPYEGDMFLDFDGAETIKGPVDRALYGSADTNLPKAWLIEDFGFTEEEAQNFIDRVRSPVNNETK